MRGLETDCLKSDSVASSIRIVTGTVKARHVIGALIERYNRAWLLERQGYKTPAQVREELALMAA